MAQIFFKKGERKPSVFSTLSFVTACLAIIAFVLAGPAFRIDLLTPEILDPADTEQRIKLLHVATRLVMVAAAFALVGVVHGRASPRVRISWRAIVAILLILPLGYASWTLENWASRTPAIHDVTTNPDDPPAFDALIGEMPNRGVALTGERYKAIHASAYGDLLPITLTGDVSAATRHAAITAKNMGWKIVSIDEINGVLEAERTSRWFGFKSLITVRVRGKAAASILDIRAVSRLGTPDMGNNARLIRKFRDALDAPKG